MNLTEYKRDARALFNYINKNDALSKYATLGKTRKDLTTLKFTYEYQGHPENAKRILQFFKKYDSIVKENKNTITVLIKNSELKPLLALYKIEMVK